MDAALWAGSHPKDDDSAPAIFVSYHACYSRASSAGEMEIDERMDKLSLENTWMNSRVPTAPNGLASPKANSSPGPGGSRGSVVRRGQSR